MILRRSSVLSAVTFVAAAMIFTACGGSGGESSSGTTASKPAASKPAAAPPANPGKVTGKVTYTGAEPRTVALKMSADPYCDSANPGGAKRTIPMVGGDGGLGGALVYVKSGLSGSYPPPGDAVVLNQEKCNYVPHVIGVQVGQEVELVNSDSTLHNVHSLPEKSKSFNLGMPNKGMKIRRKFSAAEVFVRMKCDVHPWMSAYIGVVDHPFFAVTGTDGAFTLDGLPAGTYTVAAAHPRLGEVTGEGVVTEGGSVTVDFSLGGS